MPKNPKLNIARYKVQGGELNQYEFHQNQQALAQQEQEAAFIPGTPPEVKAQEQSEKIQELNAPTQPAAKSSRKAPAKKSAKARKGSSAQAARKSTKKSTRKAKPAKASKASKTRTSKKAAVKRSTKKAVKKSGSRKKSRK